MKQFDVPPSYRSQLISLIKRKRKEADKMKKDFSPTILTVGPVKFLLARHFGFCYGVENAIDIAFRTVEENPGRNIFLLSEMIHNPHVNEDLTQQGVRFLQDTSGKTLIPFETLSNEDIVLIPAFGTTLEIEKMLNARGIHTEKYNTTCPFVEKVWNRSEVIAGKKYTIIIHGKPNHEETRATFSHAAASAPAVVVRDMAQTIELASYISGEKTPAEFYESFKGQYSDGFNVEKDLQRIGVVNQTTMLATDTQAIADYLRDVMISKYNLSEENVEAHFADTRDTLCYATNDNQSAVKGMLQHPADLAIVIGGYNSSNTSHLVELCEERLPTYFISEADKLISSTQILHYNFHSKLEAYTNDYLKFPGCSIMITSGASCPDAMVEQVIRRIAQFYHAEHELDRLVEQW